MALMDIKIFPEDVLREECAPISEFNDDLKTLVQNMAETMYANDGVGLAAPQVGIARNLIVLDVNGGEERGKQVLVLINPEIVDREGAIEWEEGCLSLPDLTVRMKRNARVTVRAQDVEGSPFEVTGEELLAVALQHEIDHLHGKLLVDFLPPMKRRTVMRELRRRKEEAQKEKAREKAKEAAK